MLYEYKGSELGKCLHTDIKTCTHDTHMLDICDTDSINSLRRERRQEKRRHETPTTLRESQSDPPTSDYPQHLASSCYESFSFEFISLK